VEHGRDDDDIAQHAIEDRIRRESEHPAPSNVAMDLGKNEGRLGDGLECGAYFKPTDDADCASPAGEP
jgi:hypothetical protein